MDLSLHQLRMFVAAARTLSLSRAAEELLLSQPAVSMQIKAMEQGLGLRLFDHVGRRIQLTAAGQDLYTRAVRLLGLADETVQAMADLRQCRAGRLRVVATTTVGIYVVPRLLGAFHRSYPDVDIRLEVANWERTSERLLSGEADVAIAGPHPHPDFQMEQFMNDQLVVIASPQHPLAARRDVTVEMLAEHPVLVREKGSGTRAVVERIFAERGLDLRPAMELSRNGAIKQVAKEGLGVAVISRTALGLELECGELAVLDVQGFPVVRDWLIITRAGFALSPAAQAFCTQIRQHPV